MSSIGITQSPSSVTASSVITQLGPGIDGEANQDVSGLSVSISSDGQSVAIGAVENDGGGSGSGHVRVFQYSAGSWLQVGSDIDGEGAGDAFGARVALSADGTTLVAGATANDGVNGVDSGHVRVYKLVAGVWTQLGSDLDGEAAGDYFGLDVAISADGTRVAAGGRKNDGGGSDSGHVRVYDWNGTNWTQVGSDIDGEAAGDEFGWSVSLSADGNRLAAGAKFNDGGGVNSGHARVFDWNGTNWIQVGADLDGEAAADQAGASVALSGDGTTVAVGAPLNESVGGQQSGHVRVYSLSGTTWVQRGSDIDAEGQYDQFGTDVSLNSDGSRLLAGGPVNDGDIIDTGHVRIFDFVSGSWTQIGTDVDGESISSQFGYSVSLASNGQYFAVGAFSYDGSGTDIGRTRVFSISTNTPSSGTSSSLPGIFLGLSASQGKAVSGTVVRFGSFAIERNSRYLLTLRDNSGNMAPLALSEGTVNGGGHLDSSVALPALSPGRYTLLLTARNSTGQPLQLGNTFTVDADLLFGSVTPESQQPFIR